MTPLRYLYDTYLIQRSTSTIRRQNLLRLPVKHFIVALRDYQRSSRAGVGLLRRSNMDMESARNWVVEHKLRAVGSLWATSLLGSLAYNFAKPGMKMSVKVIHARLHAQFLTLGALGGSALVEAYDHQAGDKAKRYEKQFQA